MNRPSQGKSERLQVSIKDLIDDDTDWIEKGWSRTFTPTGKLRPTYHFFLDMDSVCGKSDDHSFECLREPPAHARICKKCARRIKSILNL